jgi:16S rRNA (guanine527-N7)-methyltransferase
MTAQGQDDFCTMLERELADVAPIGSRGAALLEGHFRRYEQWNRVLNLSSIHDMESAVVRHYCESLFLAAHLPAGRLRIVDVGSGAGFPGIPVAVARPDCEVLLVEGHQRKAVFLKEATRALPNVRVFAGRAEQLNLPFDWVLSRAVAWEDLRSHFERLARAIGLLVGASDATQICKDSVAAWQEPIRLPWGRQRVLLIGDRST